MTSRPPQPPVPQAEITVSHQGPLPPPGQFAAYNDVVSGTAERVLAMAERDAEHVRGLELRAQAQDWLEGLLARLTALVPPVTGLG